MNLIGCLHKSFNILTVFQVHTSIFYINLYITVTVSVIMVFTLQCIFVVNNYNK